MGIRARKQREKDKRVELFVDVARHLFEVHGFENTSIQEIAEKAEFSKRTIYLYFKDKWDLFFAVLAEGITLLKDLLANPSAQSTGRDILAELGKQYFDFSQKYPLYFEGLMLFEDKYYHYSEPPEDLSPYGKVCWQLNSEVTEKIHQAVVKGLDDQSLVSCMNPLQVTLLLFGQTVGVILMIKNRQNILEEIYGMTGEELFQSHMNLILTGLSPK